MKPKTNLISICINFFSVKHRPQKTTKDHEVHSNTSKWQPMQLADPSRANSEGTFPRHRRNSSNKTAASATILRTKDLQHFKLKNWQAEPDLVDRETHFEVDLPLGLE